MSPWKIIAAAVRGPDHEVSGDPCQDAFAHWADGSRFVAAVSDGAGSARFSDVGAKRLCDVVVAELKACIANLPSGADTDQDCTAWIDCAARAVTMVRDELLYDIDQGTAPDADARLRDFAATLVACVADTDGGVFLHIGDGAGAALPEPEAFGEGVLSRPENGEFANETYFFTGEDWRERLRATPFGPSALIMLLSDGAMPFTIAQGFSGLEPRFVTPVTRFLDGVDAETGARALAATLDRSDARHISGDDKTLVWIRRQAA
jgi:hypothetical protein